MPLRRAVEQTSRAFSAYRCKKKGESESTTRSGIPPCSKTICKKKGVESITRSGGEANATTNNVGF